MHGWASTAGELPVHRTRHARRCAYYNGAAWAVGNGLASGTLVTYLALELGADAKSIGLILAAPRLAGLLRLAAPTLIAWSGNRKDNVRIVAHIEEVALGLVGRSC